MLEGKGLEVVDLGVDVDAQKLLKKQKYIKHKLSAVVLF